MQSEHAFGASYYLQTRAPRSTPESTELGSLGLGSFTTFRGCTGRNDIADAAFAARGRAGQGEREWRPKSCRRMSRRRWRRSPKCTPQAVLNAIKAHGEANASGEGQGRRRASAAIVTTYFP